MHLSYLFKVEHAYNLRRPSINKMASEGIEAAHDQRTLCK
jgi:hypothetical protein